MFGRNYLNKIFIDSRFKTPESPSDSDFTIELSENMELEPNIGCIVQDVPIPQTWYNINELNNGLYFMMNGSDYLIRLTPKTYDIYGLAGASQETMNEVTNTVIVDAFTVTPDANAGTITFTVHGGVSFAIFNDTDLSTRVNGRRAGEFYRPLKPMSINTVLRLYSRHLEGYSTVAHYTTVFVALQLPSSV